MCRDWCLGPEGIVARAVEEHGLARREKASMGTYLDGDSKWCSHYEAIGWLGRGGLSFNGFGLNSTLISFRYVPKLVDKSDFEANIGGFLRIDRGQNPESINKSETNKPQL